MPLQLSLTSSIFSEISPTSSNPEKCLDKGRDVTRCVLGFEHSCFNVLTTGLAIFLATSMRSLDSLEHCRLTSKCCVLLRVQ
ncbi:hypothetical protein YC2023_020084 [Brassica napus]